MNNNFKPAIKPLLRWAGSKRQIAHRLAFFWGPQYKRYVEPFVGSATLFFAINPSNALLSDLNKELIMTYSILRRFPDKLHEHINSLSKNKEAYLKWRGLKVSKLSTFDRAVRFMYLNKLCFNGLYRTNSKGEFNVPYAATGTTEFSSVEHFNQCAESLKKTEIQACDFGKTLDLVEKDDFVYLDPPYAVENKRMFCEYGPKPFTKKDLNRLSKYLDKINEVGASFLLSYADCSESRIIFRKWKNRRIKVRRHIAGFSSSRRHVYELLVTNINDKEEGIRRL